MQIERGIIEISVEHFELKDKCKNKKVKDKGIACAINTRDVTPKKDKIEKPHCIEIERKVEKHIDLIL